MNAGMKSKPARPIQVRKEKIGIEESVRLASDIVAPVWPLKNFIAVNPLQGLEDRPFEQAVAESIRYREINGDGNPGRAAVNRELIKWCTAFFDEGQATIAMPGREAGFYRCFADLAVFDARLNRTSTDARFLRALPESAAEAIELCLDKLGITERQREEFIRQSLAALPGWSGYVQWKSNWQRPEENSARPASVTDFVAVRLVLTCLLWPDATCIEGREPSLPQKIDSLGVSESQYRDSLLGQLLNPPKTAIEIPLARPKAQLVFCIDVRSEPFRQAIEARNDYETLGFAGFFGVPVRIEGYGADKAYDSCPVLLKPGIEVKERPCTAHSQAAERHERGRGLLGLAKGFYQTLKYNFATPFALVEMLGPWCGLWMTAKTFVPTVAGQLRQRTVTGMIPDIDVMPSLEHIDISRQADFGEQALRMMGLTSRLAPLVVFCGHGSTTENNAFASSLDCGACGGNHGGGNARILAAILNDEQVRGILVQRGLRIPADTRFVAAEHDTTTDSTILFGAEGLSGEHAAMIAQLRTDLAAAREENAAARRKTFGALPGNVDQRARSTFDRSQDWAQVRPEWGLARNAAFIVGPRELTRQANLEGCCFLHSYDWRADVELKFLTTILTAPMVVAQWINSQYFFSTIDNVAYGAGSKVTQNVTGRIGVMQGNASDLMHGLPLQSVNATDDTPYHEPLRLLAVVHAPKASLDSIVHSQEVLRKLFGNGWVNLTCIDPTDNQAYSLKRNLEWQKLA